MNEDCMKNDVGIIKNLMKLLWCLELSSVRVVYVFNYEFSFEIYSFVDVFVLV